MKIVRLFAVFPAALIISACSTTGGFWDNGSWDQEQTQLEANQYIAHDGSVQTYQTPRKYHVTSEDMDKYNAINDRIAQRRAEIHQKQQVPQNTTDTSLTHTAPSATYSPYTPPPSTSNHSNSVNPEETNY